MVFTQICVLLRNAAVFPAWEQLKKCHKLKVAGLAVHFVKKKLRTFEINIQRRAMVF